METGIVTVRSRSSFINGLAIGLGSGFLATFITLWISILFGSQMNAVTTYEHMISVFIYPLLFLWGTGVVLLTAGIVREYLPPIQQSF